MFKYDVVAFSRTTNPDIVSVCILIERKTRSYKCHIQEFIQLGIKQVIENRIKNDFL